MKHSSFATALPSSSSNWQVPRSDPPKGPASSIAQEAETRDPEGVAAFASIHKKTLAMGEAELMSLFLGSN